MDEYVQVIRGAFCTFEHAERIERVDHVEGIAMWHHNDIMLEEYVSLPFVFLSFQWWRDLHVREDN
jgi:hypothetical protein